MTEQNQRQLGSILWGIADQLRGAVNPGNFQDYRLSFLFLRYFSDNYSADDRRVHSSYPTPRAGAKPLQRRN